MKMKLEFFLNKTSPLLLNSAFVEGRDRQVSEAAVYFNFSPHPESQFT